MVPAVFFGSQSKLIFDVGNPMGVAGLGDRQHASTV
jgi:hypothetical protein